MSDDNAGSGVPDGRPAPELRQMNLEWWAIFIECHGVRWWWGADGFWTREVFNAARFEWPQLDLAKFLLYDLTSTCLNGGFDWFFGSGDGDFLTSATFFFDAAFDDEDDEDDEDDDEFYLG